jgi:hypothetical protein
MGAAACLRWLAAGLAWADPLRLMISDKTEAISKRFIDLPKPLVEYFLFFIQ